MSSQPKRRKGDEVDTETTNGKLDAEVRDMFVEQWLSEYDDIRWFFLRESACVAVVLRMFRF